MALQMVLACGDAQLLFVTAIVHLTRAREAVYVTLSVLNDDR